MNPIQKSFWIITSALIILIGIILFQNVDPKQLSPHFVPLKFPQHIYAENLSVDSLWLIIGNVKTVPDEFEKAALIALSAYPELKETKIEMLLTNSGAPMEASFKIISLFGARENRTYRILLNDNNSSEFDPILLRNLPFNAQIGILAHELGHIVYYEQLSTLQLGKWAIMYLIDEDFRAIHEKSTDLMPIYHGLGSQIYDYAYFIRHDSSAIQLYKEYQSFADKYYLTDIEIKNEIEEAQKTKSQKKGVSN